MAQESYVALMDIGEQVERSDIHAVLRLAEERPISQREINVELLGRGEDHVQGKRILGLLEEWRLVEWAGGQNFRLTESARADLRSSDHTIHIPESGYYLLHTADDPLLRDSIIDYEPVDTDAAMREYQEMKEEWKKGTDSRQAKAKAQAIISKPSRLVRYGDGGFVHINCKAKTIKIFNIDNDLYKSKERINAKLAVQVESSRMPIVTIRNGASENVVVDTPFDLDSAEVFEWLTGSKQVVDLDGEPTLLIESQGLSKYALTNFKEHYTFRNPTHPLFGKFNDVSMTVSIYPRTMDDAITWAKQLLLLSIIDYTTEEMFEEKKELAVNKFPHIYDQDEIRAKLLTYDEAVKRAPDVRQELPMLYWYLTAPNDLTAR
jgi:hypothetical protein